MPRNKNQKTSSGERTPPTREEILKFIKDSATPVGKKEIARAFHLKGDDMPMLKDILRTIKTQPDVKLHRGRKLTPKGELPEIVVCQVSEIDTDGEALARPLEWPEGERPPRIYLQPAGGHAAMAVGERALLRLRRVSPHTYTATILRRIEGTTAKMVGVYQEVGSSGRLVPTDKRQKDEVIIPRDERNGAEVGELVVAEIITGSTLGLPQGRIIERLGPAGAPRTISLIAIHTHELPTEFSKEALAEAEKAPRPTLGDRVDLRDVPLVTIDGADARDFDDAVYATREGDGWKLLVGIADVSHYVRPGSPLDRDAYKRGNSTYFPDRVVPMLPEALSNDLCSLRPNEDRYTLAAWMWLDSDGKLVKHQFVRGLMKSRARLTYEQVQAAMDGKTDELTAPLLEPVIKPLYEAYKVLLKARQARGTLDLDIPERKVQLDEKGRIADIKTRERLDSHRLIEEFMICANVAAAEALEAKNMACMYRVHEPPSMAKLEGLREFLEPLGYSIPSGRDLTPRQFSGILEKAAESPLSHMISTVILRSQSQAHYSPDNAGHFGLALVRYAHFTSPIRRYADLLVHRGLIRAYGFGEGGLSDNEAAKMPELGEHISGTERRSAVCERDAVDRYTALYLQDRVGATFPGRVSGVTRFGLFVQLDETGADGLVPMNSLRDDRYEHDDKRHCLIGQRWGRVLRLGAKCTVKLMEADALQGSTVFEITEIEEADLGDLPAAPRARPMGRGFKPKATSKQGRPKNIKAGGGKGRRRK